MTLGFDSATPRRRKLAMELLIASHLFFKGSWAPTMLVGILLAFVWGHNLLLILWIGNSFQSPRSFPFLLLVEQEVVVTGTLGLPLVCGVATVLGLYRPLLLLLAMSEWGMMFWNIDPLLPLQQASLLYNVNWGWQTPRILGRLSSKLTRVMIFPLWGRCWVIHPSFLCTIVSSRSWGLIFPLNSFQCVLLEHLNMVPSQLHLNSWAMVRAFEVLCPFFNILLVLLFVL